MPIGESGESDTEQYNFVPNKELPIPITAESTWTLDTLYKYLSDKQIYACRKLIAGWTVPEIVKGKYASKRDIGIIRFYLLQFKQYGRILWKEELYKSDALNVSYHFETNKWQVHLMYEHTSYSLGSYKDLNNALDVQSAAHFHLAKCDFLQWYKAHQVPNVYANVAFTYPLPGDEKELVEITQSSFQKTIDKRRGGVEISLASKENPVGVVFNRRRGTYDPVISGHKLGTYKNFEDALAIRQQAEAHMQAGDFDSWYADFKEKRKKDKIPYARINKVIKQGNIRYRVERSYQHQLMRLGVYASEGEALSVKKLADSHIDAGNFDEWAKDYYEKYKSEVKARRSEAMRKLMEKPAFSAAYVLCRYKIPKYVLLCYDGSGSEKSIYETPDAEEAYKTMDLANAHIEAGDFDVWIADYKKFKWRNVNV